jgi:hypothetical protein
VREERFRRGRAFLAKIKSLSGVRERERERERERARDRERETAQEERDFKFFSSYAVS